MTTQVRRYHFQGFDEVEMGAQLPDVTSFSGSIVPLMVNDVLLDPSTEATALDSAMRLYGWKFVVANPSPDPTGSAGGSSAVPSVRFASASLGSDGSSIQVAASWTSIPNLSASLASSGSKTLDAHFSVNSTPTIGEGQVRLMVEGGTYGSGTLFGADAYSVPILTSATAGGNASTNLPPATGSTTYMVKVQARATGILGTFTPRKGSSLIIMEHD